MSAGVSSDIRCRRRDAGSWRQLAQCPWHRIGHDHGTSGSNISIAGGIIHATNLVIDTGSILIGTGTFIFSATPRAIAAGR